MKDRKNYNLPSRNLWYDLLFDDKGNLTKIGALICIYYGLALFSALWVRIFKHD